MMEIEIWRRKRLGLSDDYRQTRRQDYRSLKEGEEIRYEEIFEKRLATFKIQRLAVTSKPIPMTENLTSIDSLLNNHC